LTPMPPDAHARQTERLRGGQAAFNRGEFFEAHERWEEAWHDLVVTAERIGVQGLIQIAAGLHHLRQGRVGPAARLLEKGVRKLSRGAPPPLLAGLHVGALVRDVTRLLAALEARPGTTPDISGLAV
jgi:predicted metal-dependent hydrolase